MSVWMYSQWFGGPAGSHGDAPPRPIPRPTRDEVCGIRTAFQGLTVSTEQFGPGRPWFDPDTAALVRNYDRYAVYEAHRAYGSTHLTLSLDLGGLESLPRILDVAHEAITQGGLTGIILCCMGDGQQHGGDHDPGALGFEWLIANFHAIVQNAARVRVGDHTLADHIIFVPGFDGVVPAWQPPTRVDEFVLMARGVLDMVGSAGYLGLELSAGYAVWGSAAGAETNNWATAAGQCVDVILLEAPINMGPPAPIPADWAHLPDSEKRRWTQIYQVVGRLVRPFHPYPNQPDDPHPPYLLQGGTPRGDYYVCFWEHSTYEWTRPWRTGGPPLALEIVNARRQALYAHGLRYVG